MIAQDTPAWEIPQSQNGARAGLTTLQSLAVDSRPKIRKRAQDALAAILQRKLPGPALDHPAGELCANSALNNLRQAVDALTALRKKRRDSSSNDAAVSHALQLVKTIAVASGGWPSKSIEPLCELLLLVSRSSNDYLVMSAFEVFEIIFSNMRDETSSSKLPRLLEAIGELIPARTDSQLLPPWIAIMSRGYEVRSQVEPEVTLAELPELFDAIAAFLTSPSYNIRVSASECLISFFANCIPASVISEPSIHNEKILQRLGDRTRSLLTVKYQTSWMEVFRVISSLIDALRWRGDPFLLPIVAAVGELRANDAFQAKKEADEVLGHAIRNIGPEAVLGVLPLNLANPQKGQPGRAWLLPLLRDHVTNTNLTHFRKELVPLSEAMYTRVMAQDGKEKTMEVKIFETVISQLWSALPGYCDLPLDLRSAMDQTFAEQISNLLYQQNHLRRDLCRALQNLVESNQAALDSDSAEETLLFQRVTKSDAEDNLTHLGSLAANLLAVLFNVYSQTPPQQRAYILQCIDAYLSITPEKDLVDTFTRVSTMLEAELPKSDSITKSLLRLSRNYPRTHILS